MWKWLWWTCKKGSAKSKFATNFTKGIADSAASAALLMTMMIFRHPPHPHKQTTTKRQIKLLHILITQIIKILIIKVILWDMTSLWSIKTMRIIYLRLRRKSVLGRQTLYSLQRKPWNLLTDKGCMNDPGLFKTIREILVVLIAVKHVFFSLFLCVYSVKTTFHIYVLIDSLSFYYLDYNSLSGLFKTVRVILLVLIAGKQVFYYSLSLCLFSEDLTFHTS